MEKTLEWLAPLAANTTKANHGFGWVGEWANTGSDVNSKPTGGTYLLRIETLCHANKEKTDLHILELVVWLHHLVSQAMAANSDLRSNLQSGRRAKIKIFPNPDDRRPRDATGCKQEEVDSRNKQEQEFATTKMRLSKHQRLCKSSSHSLTREMAAKDRLQFWWPLSIPIVDFDNDRIKALDVIDRLDPVSVYARY